MKNIIDDTLLQKIESDFKRFAAGGKIMKDGAISMDRYQQSSLRIMWVLKQNIDYDYDDYSQQLLQNLDKVSASPTWRRLAHASHGLLSGIRNFATVKQQEKGECLESMISTAIVNVNKELGGSRSTDQSVREGYEKFKDLLGMQIEAYQPDVMIAGMVGVGESLKPVVESIYKTYTGESEFHIGGNSQPRSADVAWLKSGKKIFLWAYHPSYTRISDKDYYDGIMNAYDQAQTP